MNEMRETTQHAQIDAVELELFTNRFRSLVNDMGERLRRTAVSVNIKERRDFSCALLDSAGRLVVNAPHIPVHLGALGLCVRTVTSRLELGPGDVAVTNHPAYGGSHLPDVTVITAVFSEGRRLGYVASRAHHAEIGGRSPGSMPPDSRSLSEEGVVLEPSILVRSERADWSAIRQCLSAPPWPSRAVEENLADLAAAVAANRRGAAGLEALAVRYGADTVLGRMRQLSAQSGEGLARALSKFADGVYQAEEFLDDGSPLRVRMELAKGRLRIDFGGTAPTHAGNLNATPGIVRSVVLYVLRTLVAEPLPLNEGLLENVEISIPRGILNPEFPADPASAPAVVGGNVETSQRLVDTLLKAFGVVAGSQGTMNNVLFGDERFGYYETVGGGCGAGPGFAGASAVHSHMTNTAITDVEVLEQRYPVQVKRFAVRRNSGGRGRFAGGDGIERQLVFLAPLEVSLLTQHRVEAPYGLAGGEPGKRGSQEIVRASGERIQLGSIDGCHVQSGDLLILRTPGGGGFGVQEDAAD